MPMMTKSRALFVMRLWLCTLLAAGAMLLLGAPQPARAQGLPDFTELVERVSPAVVNIRTLERGNGRSSAQSPQGELDPRMEEFFRRFGIPVPPGAGRGNPRQERGGGEQGNDKATHDNPPGSVVVVRGD